MSSERSKDKRKGAIARLDSPKNSPHRAFIVQFRDPTGPHSRGFSGRAEHVMSGQYAGFETPEELVDFFGRVMDQRNPQS